MTRLLLANGAKTDARDGSGWGTALHIAAVSDHTETAALILDWGGDVNVLSSGGDPPLYQAAHWGRADMVRLLLSRGADPDIQANTGVSPLHGAASNVARSGSAAVVSLLLSHGAKPNLRRSHSNPGFITRAGETGYSPLDDLVVRGYGGYAEAARILREAGGKCFVRTSPLCGEVHVAVDFSSSGSGTVSAAEDGSALSDGDEVRQGATVMFTATPAAGHYVSGWSGNCAEIGEIADGLDGTAKVCAAAADSDLSVRAEFSEIPSLAGPLCPSGSLSANGLTQAELNAGLVSAAQANNLEDVCEHLRRGASVEAQEQSGTYRRTALMIAAYDRYLELAKLLHANGADVNSRVGNGGMGGRANPGRWRTHGDSGFTALMYAAGAAGAAGAATAAGRAEMIGWLLDNGADPNLGDSRGRVPLFEAAFYGRVDVMGLLLDGGADVDGTDVWGLTPLHAAGPHYNYGSGPEWSYAATVAGYLLSRGADVNARDSWGRSPLDMYAEWSHPNAAAVLRNAGGKCFVRTGPLCGVDVAVDFSSSGSGTVSAEGDGGALSDGGEVRQGATVVFTATPAAGRYVSGWSGNCAEVGEVADGLDGTAKSCAVSADSDLSVRAEFSEIPSLAGPLCPSGSLSANGLTQAELNNSLITAAGGGDLAGVCEHLRRGAEVDGLGSSRRWSGWSALMVAAGKGRLEVMRLLLANGAQLDGRGVDGWTALHRAAGWGGQVEAARLLLDRGASVDAQADRQGAGYRRPLYEAAHWGRADVAELLLAHGADANAVDAWDITPLHGTASDVAQSGSAAIVSLLLSHGANLNPRRYQWNPSLITRAGDTGHSPLDDLVARGYGGFAEAARILRDAGGKCFVETGTLCGAAEVVTAETVCESGSLSADGLTQAELNNSLITAAGGGDLAGVCEHLRRGAEVDGLGSSRRWSGWSALMVAAGKGRLEVMRLLLANGAQLDGRGVDGWTALHRAAGWGGQVEAARLLLDRGASVDAQADRQGAGYRRPLYEAAHWGRADVAELLLAHGADANAVDAWDITPLHGTASDVAQSGSAAIVSLLLSHGANLNPRRYQWNPSLITRAGDTGHSPLDDLVARGYGGFAEAARILRDAGGKCFVETGTLCGVAEVVAADSLECPAGTLLTNGLTAAELNMTLRMAARGGDATRVCEALKRGAEVNDNLDDSEFTPLQEAVSGGHLEAAKVLLANGAEVNKRKDGAGHSPLDLAARDGEAEIAALLRNADGRCFLETGPLCRNVPVATSDPVTVVNTVAATVASTVVATVANTVVAAVENTVASTVAAGSCPAGTLPTNGMTQAQLDYEFLGAVLENDLEGACEYLRRGANIEIREDEVGRPHNLSALMIAAGRGGYNYPDMTRLLLANGAKTDARDGSGWVTALHYAAASGHTETAALILDWGGDVNVLSSGGDPPLYQAAHWGRADMVRLLLSRGADPDIQANTGVTPLHGAASNVARSGSAAVVSLLLSYDADPNLRRSLPNPGFITRAGETGHSPLDDLVARGYGNYAEAARILRDAGGKCFVRTSSLCQNVPVATPDPVTVVNTVAATVVATVANTVASTVAAGSCPAGTLPTNGMTQAQLDDGFLGAALENDVEEVCNYLRRGANIEIRTDQVGRPHHRSEESATALMIAGRNNYSDLARLLLSNGADVDSTGGPAGGGWSALHIAAYEDHADVARVLLDGGADPDVDTGFDHSSFWTPLHEAAYYNHWRIMKILLTSGANSNIQTTRPGWRGGAPLHYVFDGTRSGSALAVSVLVAGDADVNLRDSGGNSALDLAANRGDAASAEILRAAGGQCFVSTSSLCGSAPALAAAAAESAPAADRLRESFAGAFNPSPAFGDAFGATSGSSQRFLSRLDSLMRSASGSGGNAWDSFAGWQRENEHGRMWFSTGQRGDFGFGAGVGGAGGDLSASPFAAMVGNGMLAGGETGLGAESKLRIAAFADYQARSLLDGTDRQWTKWAASGTAIETAMTEAERFSGLAENQTRGAMTEIHLGGGDLGVALQAGAVSESDAMLSGTADDENLRGLRARTAFAGFSGAANLFGSGWRLRGSAHLGRSWAESESMLRDGDLWASAFSAGLERGGWLYSDDGFVLRFSQPLRVESLEMELIGADGASRLGADPSGRQLDVDAAYRLPLSGGGWLLLSAGVRRDGGHTSSSDLEAGALFSVERGF